MFTAEKFLFNNYDNRQQHQKSSKYSCEHHHRHTGNCLSKRAIRLSTPRTIRGAEYLFMECHGMNQSVATKRSTTSSIFILVVGASGDVAKKKIYPALFELYKRYFVPSSSSSSSLKSGCTVRIHGFARTEQSTDQFRNQIRYGLKYYRNHGSFFPHYYHS